VHIKITHGRCHLFKHRLSIYDAESLASRLSDTITQIRSVRRRLVDVLEALNGENCSMRNARRHRTIVRRRLKHEHKCQRGGLLNHRESSSSIFFINILSVAHLLFWLFEDIRSGPVTKELLFDLEDDMTRSYGAHWIALLIGNGEQMIFSPFAILLRPW
jgi:hypothetical protein